MKVHMHCKHIDLAKSVRKGHFGGQIDRSNVAHFSLGRQFSQNISKTLSLFWCEASQAGY